MDWISKYMYPCGQLKMFLIYHGSDTHQNVLQPLPLLVENFSSWMHLGLWIPPPLHQVFLFQALVHQTG